MAKQSKKENAERRDNDSAPRDDLEAYLAERAARSRSFRALVGNASTRAPRRQALQRLARQAEELEIDY